jgi:hypothetical protein
MFGIQEGDHRLVIDGSIWLRAANQVPAVGVFGCLGFKGQ